MKWPHFAILHSSREENIWLGIFSAKSFYVAVEFGSKELTQLLAISLKEHENNLSLKALLFVSKILKLFTTLWVICLDRWVMSNNL